MKRLRYLSALSLILFVSFAVTAQKPAVKPSDVSETFLALMEAVVDMLAIDPDGKVVMVGYSGTNRDDKNPLKNEVMDELPKAWDPPEVLSNKFFMARSYFSRQNISPKRISEIDGGYRHGRTHIELWFVPKDGVAPTLKPSYRIRKRVVRSRINPVYKIRRQLSRRK